MKVVNVAVGVVLRNNACFICKRSANQHQGGKWEFPGGKVEDGETPESALARELKEEIGIECIQFKPLITIEHDYSDKLVKLFTYIVSEFDGEPKGLEGQPFKWVAVESLSELEFPDANTPIITALTKSLS